MTFKNKISKKNQRKIYDALIKSWTNELQIAEKNLRLVYQVPFMDKIRGDSIVVHTIKNRIKRAKWNITRATNLKNKL